MTLTRRQTLIGAAATVAAAALPAVKAELTDAEWLASLPSFPVGEAIGLSEFEILHNRIMAYQAYYDRIPDDLKILPESV